MQHFIMIVPSTINLYSVFHPVTQYIELVRIKMLRTLVTFTNNKIYSQQQSLSHLFVLFWSLNIFHITLISSCIVILWLHTDCNSKLKGLSLYRCREKTHCTPHLCISISFSLLRCSTSAVHVFLCRCRFCR